MISQREARRLRKRVDELDSILKRQKNAWASDWRPGWINIETAQLSDASFAKINTARKLGHAVVVIPGTANQILFYADSLKEI